MIGNNNVVETIPDRQKILKDESTHQDPMIGNNNVDNVEARGAANNYVVKEPHIDVVETIPDRQKILKDESIHQDPMIGNYNVDNVEVRGPANNYVVKEPHIEHNDVVQTNPENKVLNGFNDKSELRYATFGTSLTWGSIIEDRTNKAYPWLLSKNAANYAIRASDASYPSMCTQSMLEDNIYDVIVVEYDRRSPEYASNLARRLRQRFPDATIIYTRMWNLMDVFVKDNKTGKESKLREYIDKSGQPRASPEALEFVLNSDVKLHLDHRMPNRIKKMEEIYSRS